MADVTHSRRSQVRAAVDGLRETFVTDDLAAVSTVMLQQTVSIE